MRIKSLGEQVIALPRGSKRWIVMAADASLCALTCYLAVYLRLGEVPNSGGPLWILIASSIVIALPIFAGFGLYRTVFSQSGSVAISQVAPPSVVYGLVFSSIFTFGGIIGIPRTVGIIQPILLFLFSAATRAFASFWLGGGYTRMANRRSVPRVLIYGVGHAGRQLHAALRHSNELEVVGFLDDDPQLQGRTTSGSPIFAPEDAKETVRRLGVSEVLLAIPSATQQRRNQVLQAMRHAAVYVRTLPGIGDIANGRVKISDLRELDIEDLLGRDPVTPDPTLIGAKVHGKTVMVTGAGGSIGSELCRQALAVGPRELLLVDMSEYALYALHRELSLLPEVIAGSVTVIPLLGSVTDAPRMRAIVEAWRPDTIFHAAAYKHVPLVEHNACQGVYNNIIGTLTMSEVANAAGVPDFVLISTDKAVRPTNIMGTTKRVAELTLQALNADGATTRFSMVRFGNVLGSSGSVVPLFREQVRSGGPVTITDYRITRYFMTIPEAAQLVIQASAMANGGDVFVLDMGKPVAIVDLARNMIELAGLSVRDEENPHGDVEIAEVGLRPGEKLYEELLIGENPVATSHPRIFKAHEHYLSLEVLRGHLATLQSAVAKNDVVALIRELRTLVPEFTPEGPIVDWLSSETIGTRNSRIAAAEQHAQSDTPLN